MDKRIQTIIRGQRFTLNTVTKFWSIPETHVLCNVCVYVNGLRYERNVDFFLDSSNRLKLTENNEDPTTVILIDYEFFA